MVLSSGTNPEAIGMNSSTRPEATRSFRLVRTSSADRGARVQRPLWASTSTKDPDYPDTLYVDTLIGPDTVNTMPEATLDAFEDHGTLARSVDADPDAAQRTLDAIEAVGVDLDEVSRVLEDQGVATFAKSFDELISALEAKAESTPGGSG